MLLCKFSVRVLQVAKSNIAELGYSMTLSLFALSPPVQERTKNAQFIIISLRNNMFELADRLVGIYKTDNCTKSVTIDPNKLSQGLRPAASTQA